MDLGNEGKWVKLGDVSNILKRKVSIQPGETVGDRAEFIESIVIIDCYNIHPEAFSCLKEIGEYTLGAETLGLCLHGTLGWGSGSNRACLFSKSERFGVNPPPYYSIATLLKMFDNASMRGNIYVVTKGVSSFSGWNMSAFDRLSLVIIRCASEEADRTRAAISGRSNMRVVPFGEPSHKGKYFSSSFLSETFRNVFMSKSIRVRSPESESILLIGQDDY